MCLAFFCVNRPRQVYWIGQTALAAWIVFQLNLIIVRMPLIVGLDLLCVRAFLSLNHINIL